MSFLTPSSSRLVLALIATALAFAVPVSASAPAFTARVYAPSHSPTVGKPWPTTVTATRGTTKLSGTVRYQVLYQGTVVNTEPIQSFARGVYRRTLTFLPAAAGLQLTLRIWVKTRLGSVTRDWAIQVRR